MAIAILQTAFLLQFVPHIVQPCRTCIERDQQDLSPTGPSTDRVLPIDTTESDVTRKETTPGIVGELASAPSNPT